MAEAMGSVDDAVDEDDVGQEIDEHEGRSVAQLKMLHNLAPRLNRLNESTQIGEAITAELKTLIDYHNCRIYLLQPDGKTLWPIVFRGDLTEYEGETYEELVTMVGEGITGHVAETGESFSTPNALECEWGVQIPGTSEIVESILAVPMKYADRIIGVIVLSNLGYGQFDEQDMRLLEVLASHAAVAFENAHLFQLEREAAETASVLLGLSQALTGVHDVGAVLQRVTADVPSFMSCESVSTYTLNPVTGAFERAYFHDHDQADVPPPPEVDGATAARFLASLEEPFVLPREVAAAIPAGYNRRGAREILVAPLRWDPDGFAVVVVVAPEGASFTEADLSLARGIADIASLALGSARRFHELERFHELVESLEAVFWEAEPATLDFTFLSRRAGVLFGTPEEDKTTVGAWGDHVHPNDRTDASIRLRQAIDAGGDHILEYRALGREGETVWLRDLVHVARNAKGSAQVRGLMVDVTDRKRAEQALRRSERKYLEAFHREREASQRLRALDDMKNTFLEAVSHDLRTPLTSILGSALTLEQTGMSLPREDAADLLRRIAANARKLERLLSDLLDVDRLQRGIISPQRRQTDVAELIRRTVDEADLLGDRSVEIDVEEPMVVNLDSAKVERIVENLLANAARHTPTGSKVWVSARPHERGVLLVVEDEGDGVPLELREAIFEPFRQGPGRSGHSPGVGVGLSLVARFAELHGGSAWVQERAGGGASFHVYLPEG